MFWKSKKVLITGGAGFIGSNLSLKLYELGTNVEVIDDFNPFCGANIFNLHEIEKKIRIHRENICSAMLESLVADKDFIFHLAGQIGHLFSQQKPESDLEMNARATLRLLEACKKTNSKAKIIFTSTRQVFGEPQYLPVDEKHPISPIDINGIHKSTAEQYLSMYYKVYNIQSCILRLTNTYGPRQSIKNNQLGVIGWFINRTINNETLPLASSGSQIRDFCFVDDVVDALILAAQNKNTWGKSFNLSGEKTSLRDLAEKMISIAKKGKIGDLAITNEEKKIQLKDYYGTNHLFESVTGWIPKVSIQEGLSKTLNYFEKNKSSYL